MNRKMDVYNGVSNNTFYQGHDDDLYTTSPENLINETYTNGMQFKPQIDNQNSKLNELKVFDQENLMFQTFTDGHKISEQIEGIDIFYYSVSEPFNGQNVELAYGQLYTIYGANCYGCDADEAMRTVTIDGEQLTPATDSSESYVEIEPVTGVMTKIYRSYTMVFTLSCFDTQLSVCYNYGQMPFPDLDEFALVSIPIFNVTESITIDKT